MRKLAKGEKGVKHRSDSQFGRKENLNRYEVEGILENRVKQRSGAYDSRIIKWDKLKKIDGSSAKLRLGVTGIFLNGKTPAYFAALLFMFFILVFKASPTAAATEVTDVEGAISARFLPTEHSKDKHHRKMYQRNTRNDRARNERILKKNGACNDFSLLMLNRDFKRNILFLDVKQSFKLLSLSRTFSQFAFITHQVHHSKLFQHRQLKGELNKKLWNVLLLQIVLCAFIFLGCAVYLNTNIISAPICVSTSFSHCCIELKFTTESTFVIENELLEKHVELLLDLASHLRLDPLTRACENFLVNCQSVQMERERKFQIAEKYGLLKLMTTTASKYKSMYEDLKKSRDAGK
uniref:Uncharacterized protein n=1 Tax=Ditylenchus dipsaci TaxID=166011 RepID=A0A915DXQ9_9BILA